MVKTSSYGKQQMKEGLWTDENDTKMLPYAPNHGAGNWTAMPKKTGFRRSCGKNCRIRWNNQSPDLLLTGFSPEEEEMIIKLHATIGSRWSIIAQQLPGRTDNEVKSLWNTKLKKKLSAMGIDPVTHRPFSQILADYGNIGGFPKARTRFGCLSRDIKSSITIKTEQYCSTPEISSNFNTYFTTRIATSPHDQVETSRDRFTSNISTNPAANDHSLNLLSQLQAIKMVTEASNYTTPETISAQIIPTECISSSASSASPESPNSATNKTIASPNFSWCDFLLEDAFLPTNAQDQEHGMKLDVNTKGKQASEERQSDSSIKNIEASSLSNCSFVEGIIEREHEMLSDFPGLLEEPFYF